MVVATKTSIFFVDGGFAEAKTLFSEVRTPRPPPLPCVFVDFWSGPLSAKNPPSNDYCTHAFASAVVCFSGA